METSLAEESSKAAGNPATAESLAIVGIQGRNNCDKNTSTACPTAAQETAGTAGDTNNLRGARTVRNTSIRWYANNIRGTRYNWNIRGC